jgi:hypothetical protein
MPLAFGMNRPRNKKNEIGLQISSSALLNDRNIGPS